MGMDWASAIAQGIGAAANTGANIIGDQIKNDQTIQMQKQLEQQAADIRVDTASRLAAADQMMKNAALQRYSQIVKQKAGEDVPQEAQTVNQTGLTRESADEAGLKQGGFAGSMDKMNPIIQKAKDTLASPGATDAQKADAQALLDQIGRQFDAQKDVNEDAADGKTRKRTTEEAVNAANDYALMNDPEAYVAGTTAYNNANKDDIAEKRLKQQADIEDKRGQRQIQIEAMRERGRIEAIMAKLGGADGTGAGSKDPADVATIKYLTNNGMSFNDARDLVLGTGEGAHKDPVALASSMASSLIGSGAVRVTKDDPPGTTVSSKAMKMAMAALTEAQALRNGGKAGGGMLDSGGPAAPTGKPLGNDPLGLRPLLGK
jgi:hypothetical protein